MNEQPKKPRAKKILRWIVIAIVLLSAIFPVLVRTFPDASEQLFANIFYEKLPKSRLKEICPGSNYTAIVIVDNNDICTNLILEVIPDTLVAQYADENNNVSMLDFEILVYVYNVSEDETYYKMALRHIESGDILYETFIDKDYRYETYTSSYRVAKYGETAIEAVKGMPKAKFIAYPYEDKYDFEYSRKDKKDRDYTIFYGITFSDDGSLDTVYYSREKLVINVVFGEQAKFQLTDVGTTRAPLVPQ